MESQSHRQVVSTVLINFGRTGGLGGATGEAPVQLHSGECEGVSGTNPRQASAQVDLHMQHRSRNVREKMEQRQQQGPSLQLVFPQGA